MESEIKGYWYLGFILGVLLCLVLGTIARELTEAQKFYEAIKAGYSQVYDKDSGVVIWQKLDKDTSDED